MQEVSKGDICDPRYLGPVRAPKVTEQVNGRKVLEAKGDLTFIRLANLAASVNNIFFSKLERNPLTFYLTFKFYYDTVNSEIFTRVYFREICKVS